MQSEVQSKAKVKCRLGSIAQLSLLRWADMVLLVDSIFLVDGTGSI